MIVQNNILALNAQRQMSTNSLKLQSALQKLSSGYRINSAADDAAGLAISERMRAQQTGLERAIMNAQDGISMTSTAEGALGEVHSMLNRLTELAGQASNGVLNDSQRASINREAQDLLKEINRVSQATNFNGIKMLDGSLDNSAPASVEVSGVPVGETAATAGEYTFSFGQPFELKAGDEISFSLNLGDAGASQLSFTVSDDLQSMTGSDGTTYQLNGTVNGDTVQVDAGVMMDAVANSYQSKSPGAHFTMESDGNGAMTLTNREAGTDAATAYGLNYNVNRGAWSSAQVSSVAPTDTSREISADSFTVFDGSNQDAATFSVNGSKFVLVEEADYADTISQLEGSDVTAIRVSSQNLTADDLTRVAADINHKTGMAFSATATGLEVKAPKGGDGLTLQVGDTAANFNQVTVGVPDMSARGLGLDSIDLSTQAGAASALSRINSAIDKVSSARGDLGATQNRLQSTLNNLQVTNENITAAESRIRDTDMAKMLMEYTKRNILQQSSQAMLAQANLQQQQVLQLLR